MVGVRGLTSLCTFLFSTGPIYNILYTLAHQVMMVDPKIRQNDRDIKDRVGRSGCDLLWLHLNDNISLDI